MRQEDLDASAKFMLYAVKGDTDAYNFLQLMFEVIHTWDDLVDRDQVLSEQEINSCFWTALIALPSNEFYRQHFLMLHPIVVSSTLNWFAANSLELDFIRSGNQHKVHTAFILRGTYAALVQQCALILGGAEWAAKIAEGIQSFAYPEPFEQYRDDLLNEPRCRDAQKEREL